MPVPSPETVATVLRHADARLEQSRETLFDLLRIPSISAQEAHRADCARAASWAHERLVALGFRADIRPTPGHPVVVGHIDGPAGYTGPHILFYGHYDVQPPDPLDLWTSPPFEPQLVDGPRGKRFVARGAVDDKGQMTMFLEALRAWHEAGGGIPARITVIIEGEEEVGSRNLEPFLKANKAELASDIALISDTNMWDYETPALTTSLRGLTYVQLTVKAAKRDLHSGLYGGSALNPINALTHVLGELHDADGRIQLPGFYDGVKPISNARRAQWDQLGFDEAAFLGGIGLSVPSGERGYSALERLWARPTADINGIWGGYTGQGAKTVIAAEASAKITFRLVPGQDPDAVMEQFIRFVAGRLQKAVLAPAGVDKQDVAVMDIRPLLEHLRREDVQVVQLVAQVHDHARPVAPLNRDLVNGLAVGHKVARRVQVRAHVVGGHDVLGVHPLLRFALDVFHLERRVERPE